MKTFIIGLLLFASLLAYDLYRCPVDKCSLIFTGMTELDERGQMWYQYNCGCCGRTFSVKR